MAGIVLVHGAWHGGWCWDAVTSGLAAQGHQVQASELHRGSLAGDVAAVQTDVDALAPDGDVVVCGHSYGGMVISGLRSEGLRHLVYMATLVPEAGESAVGISELGPPAPLNDAVVFGEDGTCTVDPARAADLFYADCPPEAQAAAVARLRPQAVASLTDPSVGAVWRRVPSTYGRALQDRAVHPDTQKALADRVGTGQDWPTSHSPFMSVPDRVVALLALLAS
jgi:pimeloyl-ACP methyl ester carboxylesterase